jgi:hypothetical protein
MKNINKNTKTNTASTFRDRATKSSATKPAVKTTPKRSRHTPTQNKQ